MVRRGYAPSAIGDSTRVRTEAGGSELAERIGVLEFRFRLEAVAGSLVFRQREAALLWGSVRLPLPASCVPRVDAREDAAGAD